MIKKFIIIKSPKFKGITKLPAQKKPKVKAFSSDASILRQHRAEKLAAKSEAQAMSIGLERVRAKGMQLFSKTKFYTTKPGTNFTIKTKEGKRALGIVERAKTRAIKIARTKGMSTLESKSKSLNVPIRRYGSQKSKFVQKLTEQESRELGFPPSEVFKSTKKTPMTDVDKVLSQFSTAEKFNPKTGKYQTIRRYDVRTKSGRMGRAPTYREMQKRRKK